MRPQGSGGAVIFLDAGQIAHVQPLHSLLGIGGGAGDVQPIAGSHALHLLQGADLFADFLPKADELIGHGPVQPVQIILLARNEVVHAIQGHPTVIADDAPAAVGIRQPGEQPRAAGGTHPCGIRIKHPIVVGFPVGGEMLLDFRVQRIAVLLQGGQGHAHAAIQVYDALEGSIRLQPHNHLIIPVNIPRRKIINA